MRTSLAALWGAVVSFAALADAQSTPPNAQPEIVSPVAQETEPSRLRFAWVRGEGAERCPNAETIARAVSIRLGREPFAPSAPQSVEASVHRANNRWSVSIFLRDVDGTLLGTRSLASDAVDCAGVVPPVSLAIALAIDPEAALRPLPEPTTNNANNNTGNTGNAGNANNNAGNANNTTRPTPPAVRPPVRPPVVPPTPSAFAALEGSMGLGPWLSAGLLPGWTPGALLYARMRVAGRFGVGASMRWLPERSVDDSSATVSFGLAASTLFAELSLLSHPRATLSVATGPMLGAVHAVVFAATPADPGERFFFGWTAMTRASVSLVGPLSLDAGLEAFAPVTRYLYRDGGRPNAVVFEQSWVGGGAWLAIAARFR
jgi:hypothetical protein